MARLQHFGWFFSRGFGPQGWGHPVLGVGLRLDRAPTSTSSRRGSSSRPVSTCVIIEDALSLGVPGHARPARPRGVRRPEARPAHPRAVPAGRHPAPRRRADDQRGRLPALPRRPAVRDASHHLSGHRFGVNVVTDVGSARHLGLTPLSHDAAYDRAEEWLDRHPPAVAQLGRRRARSRMPPRGHFADGSKIRPFQHDGEYFRARRAAERRAVHRGRPGDRLAGRVAARDRVRRHPLRRAARARAARRAEHPRLPHQGPGGRDRRRAESRRDQGAVRLQARGGAERRGGAPRRRGVEASHRRGAVPGARGPVERPRDRPDRARRSTSRSTSPSSATTSRRAASRGCSASRASATDVTLRELIAPKVVKGRIADRAGFVGTAEQIADFIEEIGDEADNDGFIFSGDLHPVTAAPLPRRARPGAPAPRHPAHRVRQRRHPRQPLGLLTRWGARRPASWPCWPRSCRSAPAASS